jgi:type IV secretory pathway VirB10-like protein
MAFDPNDRQNEFRNPEVHNTTQVSRSGSSSWVGWVAVIAVILVGAFVWSQMGGSSTDPQTTSSTNPPVTDNSSPAPAAPAPAAPMAPATPAPATPPAGGTGGTQP